MSLKLTELLHVVEITVKRGANVMQFVIPWSDKEGAEACATVLRDEGFVVSVLPCLTCGQCGGYDVLVVDTTVTAKHLRRDMPLIRTKLEEGHQEEGFVPHPLYHFEAILALDEGKAIPRNGEVMGEQAARQAEIKALEDAMLRDIHPDQPPLA
jgi:hypothetical protein